MISCLVPVAFFLVLVLQEFNFQRCLQRNDAHWRNELDQQRDNLQEATDQVTVMLRRLKIAA